MHYLQYISTFCLKQCLLVCPIFGILGRRFRRIQYHELERMFGRLFLFPFSLRGFCNDSWYYNSDIHRRISRIHHKPPIRLVHHCPLNSFPTNPTSIGIRDPRNPPSCIKCFLFMSEVFLFANSLKQYLCRLSLCFSSSVIGICPCNILWTQSQIQWTSSIPPSSIIRLHFCLSCLTLLIEFNSRENTCTLWAIIAEWNSVKMYRYLYGNINLTTFYACVRSCVRACVRSCVRAFMRACVRECVRECVRACVHACVRACVSGCMRACVPAFMRACVRSCVRACVRSCVGACVRACVRACLRSCMGACVRACVRACVPEIIYLYMKP